MERPVIFDIDYTLFSPQIHRELYLPAMARSLVLDEQRLKEAHEGHGKTLKNRSDYHHVDYLSHLSKELSLHPDILEGIYLNPAFFMAATYPDVYSTLSFLHKNQYQLGIFSEGFDDLQKLKLDLPGISKFFTPDFMSISRRKKTDEAISSIPKNSILIDDKIEIAEILSAKRPDIQSIWINRGSAEVHPTIPTVQTLAKLPELVA